MTPLLENVLVPATASHTALTCWDISPLPSDGQTAHTLFETNNLGVPSFGFGIPSPPAPRAQFHPEGMLYFQRMGFSYYDSFPHTTSQQVPLFPQTVDPYLLVNGSGTAPTVPGFTVDWSPATPVDTGIPAVPVPGHRARNSTECTKDIRQFLRMRSDHQYECLWKDGSGRPCGQLGTLLAVKRHLRSDHDLKRYAPWHIEPLGD